MKKVERVKREVNLLQTIEKIGNKIPHTMSLFLWLMVIVAVLSFVLSKFGVSVIDPATGGEIAVVNLISSTGIMEIATGLVSNFASFSILGVTIVVGIAMGLCETGGFFQSAIKFSLSKVKSSHLALIVSFFGVFMCSFDGAVSHLVVASLAGAIYLSVGKNPLVGVMSGYAAAATGAAMEFVPAFWQVALTPLTIEYAQIVDPSFSMSLMSDSYVMLTASVLAVLVNAIVTVKVIEPRLGKYTKKNVVVEDESLTAEQKKAVKVALICTALYLVALVAICLPKNSIMRSETGSLVVGAPLMTAFENLLFFLFFIPGFVYAKMTGQIGSTKDLVALLEKGLLGIVPFIVLTLVISQFLAIFQVSNLAQVIAISGGNLLASLNVNAIIVVLIIFIAYALINLFIVSGSTQYMLFGSFLVPMLMQMNFHPAFIQVLLRLGDGSTNQISPLNPFFPVVVMLCGKYDEDCTVGTILSNMVVFAFWNMVMFIAVLLVFYFFNLPLGISGVKVFM